MLDASTGVSDRQLDVSDPDQRNKTVRSAAWDRDSRNHYAPQGISISAVRIERTAHPVPRGDVSAGQRHCVVRDRIELSTFRFSEGLSFPTPPGEY